MPARLHRVKPWQNVADLQKCCVTCRATIHKLNHCHGLTCIIPSDQSVRLPSLLMTPNIVRLPCFTSKCKQHYNNTLSMTGIILPDMLTRVVKAAKHVIISRRSYWSMLPDCVECRKDHIANKWHLVDATAHHIECCTCKALTCMYSTVYICMVYICMPLHGAHQPSCWYVMILEQAQ